LPHALARCVQDALASDLAIRRCGHLGFHSSRACVMAYLSCARENLRVDRAVAPAWFARSSARSVKAVPTLGPANYLAGSIFAGLHGTSALELGRTRRGGG
jgi:hypothetical protein